VGIPHAAYLTLWSVSSQAVWALASGSAGALLVSLFNVEWECYAWAGSVEESKFCLFLVVFPVRCISSISPRFYFRKHAFCFLPLVTILESPHVFFKNLDFLQMKENAIFVFLSLDYLYASFYPHFFSLSHPVKQEAMKR
jgi:hypothetical protein